MNARKMIMVPEYRPLYAMKRCWGQDHGPLSPTLVPIDIIGELLLQSGREAVTIYEMEVVNGKTTGNHVQLTLENYKLPYEQIANGAKEPDHGTVATVSNNATPIVTVEPTVVEEEPATSTPDMSSVRDIVEDVEQAREKMSKPIDEAHHESKVKAPEASQTKKEETKKPEAQVAPVMKPEVPEVPAPETTIEEPKEETQVVETATDNVEIAAALGIATEETVKEEAPAATVTTTADPYAGMTKAERRAAKRKEAEAKAAAEQQHVEQTPAAE